MKLEGIEEKRCAAVNIGNRRTLAVSIGGYFDRKSKWLDGTAVRIRQVFMKWTRISLRVDIVDANSVSLNQFYYFSKDAYLR